MGWNILKEQVFPVVYTSGKRASLGMYDVLKEADKIQEIHTGCPGDFGDFLLIRLLTTFVQAAYKFCDDDASDKLEAIRDGSFNIDKIDQYIQYCKDSGVSFDLTGDGERLFLQPETDLEKLKKDKKALHPLADFAYWIPSGSADIFHNIRYNYETNTDIEETGLTATEYLCALLHNYFCHSGNAQSGKDGIQMGKNGQLPSYLLLRGRNLFETIILSCGHMSEDQYGHSIPIWEAPGRDEELTELDPNNGETGNLSYMYTRSNVLYPGPVNPETNRIMAVYWLWSRIDFSAARKYWAMNDPHIIKITDEKKGLIAKRLNPLIDQPWMECAEVLPCDKDCQNLLLKDLVKMRQADKTSAVPQNIKVIFYFYQYKYKGETINTIYNSKAVIEENVDIVSDQLMPEILRGSVRNIKRVGNELARAVRWNYYKQIHPDAEWNTSIPSKKKRAIDVASQEYSTFGEPERMMFYHAMKQFMKDNEDVWYYKIRKVILDKRTQYAVEHNHAIDSSVIAEQDEKIQDLINNEVKTHSIEVIEECFRQNGINGSSDVLAAVSANNYLKMCLNTIFKGKENCNATGNRK